MVIFDEMIANARDAARLLVKADLADKGINEEALTEITQFLRECPSETYAFCHIIRNSSDASNSVTPFRRIADVLHHVVKVKQ